nr:zinc finger protein 483-like [Microcebus murinus]
MWAKSQYPENPEDMVTLIEDWTQTLGRKRSSLSKSAISQEENSEEDTTVAILHSYPSESITFKDVTMNFSRGGWRRLDPAQKKLCKEVALENYRNLEFLGKGIPVSHLDLLSQLNWIDLPWLLQKIISKSSTPETESCSVTQVGVQCMIEAHCNLELLDSIDPPASAS